MAGHRTARIGILVVAILVVLAAADYARGLSIGTLPPAFRWANEGKWGKLDADTHKSLRYAGRLYGVSYSWLHSCVHSEGGHGSREPHSGWHATTGGLYFPIGSAGEHGPAQILDPSNWMGNAAARTVPSGEVPKRFVRNRDSVLGQAVVLAWGLSHGYGSHWHGSGC